ncbi:3-ketodihydrosphingosine reductase [Fopius arisanus]|uniref:3-dehydrosphinganine reductase n=1 Tax=Fopius arisanus TaxID=64838 RepID=A0A0C9QE85_9HYME|nr:PREDICTED: 3-ketodihydrosphingosine reductase [Fopius arisanus]XP_011310818.1 PREDICTED: 3-ketodihydrosphingosine reductase [Fopius arisanus]XP_011310820.1 PREDICTED: 3-ketodihydrosphingosine reductase [Fopius arisanus]XP_011310821.1 PREDICTED: 3-ketodihydrosphingosine reductase [Fopius arisanus]
MSAVFGVCLVLFVLVLVILIAKQLYWSRRIKSVEGKHVVITGGSSGIGRSVAILAAKNGAHVTIIARDTKKLEAVRNELLSVSKNRDSQKHEILSLDITAGYNVVEKALSDVEGTMGAIYMLVNCAGTAIASKVEDTTPDNLKWMMDLNFMGTFHCIKSVVPKMKSARDGIIVLTSSQAALLGIFGYGAYCSSKFAVRGLAETVAMELKPYNIFVTLSMPPDTDTPGFAVEELTKPVETKLISGSSGAISPDVVAHQMFEDALAGKFFSTSGIDGFMLTTLCCGMSPVSSFAQLVLEVLLMGPFRLVSACYLASFDRIIKSCMKTRDLNKKSQ